MITDRHKARVIIRKYYEHYAISRSVEALEYFYGVLNGLVRAFYEADYITIKEWRKYESFFDKVYYMKKEELKRDTAGH